MRRTITDLRHAQPLFERIDSDAPATSKRNRDDIGNHLATAIEHLDALRDSITGLLLDLESGDEGRVWTALTRLGDSGIGMSTADLVGYAVKAQTAAARTVAAVETVLREEDAR